MLQVGVHKGKTLPQEDQRVGNVKERAMSRRKGDQQMRKGYEKKSQFREGSLPPKKSESIDCAMITKKGKCPPDWRDSGPMAYGILQLNEFISSCGTESNDRMR